jgi:transposase
MKGQASEFFRWMLKSHLDQYDFPTSHIAVFESKIAENMTPYGEQIQLLTTITGVERLMAWNLIAELGADMSVFPDAAHCASWAGLAPGTHESASKQKFAPVVAGARRLLQLSGRSS